MRALRANGFRLTRHLHIHITWLLYVAIICIFTHNISFIHLFFCLHLFPLPSDSIYSLCLQISLVSLDAIEAHIFSVPWPCLAYSTSYLRYYIWLHHKVSKIIDYDPFWNLLLCYIYLSPSLRLTLFTVLYLHHLLGRASNGQIIIIHMSFSSIFSAVLDAYFMLTNNKIIGYTNISFMIWPRAIQAQFHHVIILCSFHHWRIDITCFYQSAI